jgi:hypothetical protein
MLTALSITSECKADQALMCIENIIIHIARDQCFLTYAPYLRQYRGHSRHSRCLLFIVLLLCSLNSGPRLPHQLATSMSVALAQLKPHAVRRTMGTGYEGKNRQITDATCHLSLCSADQSKLPKCRELFVTPHAVSRRAFSMHASTCATQETPRKEPHALYASALLCQCSLHAYTAYWTPTQTIYGRKKFERLRVTKTNLRMFKCLDLHGHKALPWLSQHAECC